LNSTTYPIFFGSNTNWQTASISFTATQTNTPLQITGLEPGMLLDAVSLTVAPNTNADSLQFTNVLETIADHVSASWSANNLVSVLGSSNVTVQWSIMADSLYETNNPHGFGSLLRYGSGALGFNHNLYADNYSANPRLGDNLQLDFVNNVIYDWGTNAAFSMDDTTNDPLGFTNQLNYVCNYLIATPDSVMTNIAFWGGSTNTWIFQSNNVIDYNTNGILDGANIDWNMFTNWSAFTNVYTRFDTRFPMPIVPPDEAFIGYERVLDFAGASLLARDGVDADIVTGVRNQTGRLISTPPSLIAWWRAEGNALDSAGTNNGTPNNITYTNGVVGQAFELNGTSSYVQVPDSAGLLNFDVRSNNFTVALWVNLASLSQRQDFIIDRGTTENQPCSYDIYFDSDVGRFVANCWDGGLSGVNVDVPSVTTPTTNKWYYLAMVCQSGQITLYVNGNQELGAPVGDGAGPIIPPTYGSTLNTEGARTIGRFAGGSYQHYTHGALDEIQIYNRALSSAEIQALYNNPGSSQICPVYLDTDQDGIPDFWETTFNQYPYVPSNNHVSDNSGYTDLEEYNNWLGVPHSVTVTNTPDGVDLYLMSGDTGNLSFFVTNAVNGTVYLTNVLNYTNVLGVVSAVTNTGIYSNRFAIFTPVTNYSGFASFDYYVTNNDTIAWFGPVTVSVVVSKVHVAINSNMPPVIITLTNGVPLDPCNSGGSDFYEIAVPTNVAGVLFELDNPTGPMALVINYGLPLPSLSSYDYYTNAPAPPANLEIAVLTNSTPVPMTNGDWYLAAVNVAGSNVCYSVKVTELFIIGPPLFLYPTNTTVTNVVELWPFSTMCHAVDTNIPPLPLTFSLVGANNPTNMTINATTGLINWTPLETQGPTTNGWSTNSISVSVGNGVLSVTNTFTIIVVGTNMPPIFVLTNIPNQLVIMPGSLLLTNAAINPNLPDYPLTYMLLNAPANAGIDGNGAITWTPSLAQAGTNYVITTVVTATNPWAVNAQSLSVTNSFNVMVLPPPSLTVGQPLTNAVGANSINWFAVNVPTNADFATNTLLFASLPVNLLFSTNMPPTNNDELIPNATNGLSVLSVNAATAPTNIVPGGTYYLGVQNTNSLPVTNAIEVYFHLVVRTNAPVLNIPITITPTNSSGTNGFLLSWFAPTNEVFKVEWTASLFPPITWNIFTNIITYTTFISPTNSQFDFLDNGSETGGMDPWRYYRLILLVPTAPVLPPQANWTINPLATLVVTNTATDTSVPAPTLTYMLLNAPTNAVIDTNGVITWTPTLAQAGTTNTFTTIVTDNNTPPLSATNSFTVIVNPIPAFSTVALITNGVGFQWLAPTGDQFQVQWATSLVPVIAWSNFAGVITSSNGVFFFNDTNAPLGTKFYRLVLLP
jgi:hypothetical protein